MSSQELEIQDRYDRMNQVVQAHVEGLTETQIAKRLGFKRAEVVGFLDEYKEYAKDNKMLQDRAFEVVHDYDQGQNRVISEAWELHSEAKDAGDMKLQATIQKNIADMQSKRVEVLQKVGMYAAMDMGDQIAEQEEKIQILMQLLKEIKEEHPEVAIKIAKALTKVSGEPETVMVHDV